MLYYLTELLMHAVTASRTPALLPLEGQGSRRPKPRRKPDYYWVLGAFVPGVLLGLWLEINF